MSLHAAMKISFRISPFLWTNPERSEDLLVLLADYRDTIDEVGVFSPASPPTVTVRRDYRACGRCCRRSSRVSKRWPIRRDQPPLDNGPSQREPGKLAQCAVAAADGYQRHHRRRCFLPVGSRISAICGRRATLRWRKQNPISSGSTMMCACKGTAKCSMLAFARAAWVLSRETDVAWTREELRKAFNEGSQWVHIQWRMRWLKHNQEVIHRSAGAYPCRGRPRGSRAAGGVDDRGRAITAVLATRNGWAVLTGEQQTPTMLRPGGGFYSDETPSALLSKGARHRSASCSAAGDGDGDPIGDREFPLPTAEEEHDGAGVGDRRLYRCRLHRRRVEYLRRLRRPAG